MKKYYVNLSNKWRPQIFEHVVGQKYIVLALINALKKKKIYPCYLFNGPRGTGKTSLARILAKGLLCEKKITFRPCNICFNCKQINNNNFLDLIEINGSLNTKIEDIKELIETSHYMPSKGRFRIYLIDEVHMLSTYSFNALLKILEEPPLHIKFILATTNINKIPDTIISRCLQLSLNPINDKELYSRIKYILFNEKIKFKREILNNIIHLSSGSIRDALSLLDYCLLISKNNELLNINIFKKYIGEDYHSYCYLLIKYFFNKNIKFIIKIIDKMSEINIINWDKILNFILILIHNLLLDKLNYNRYTINFNNKQINFIKNISNNNSINKIIYFYKKIIECKKEYNLFKNNIIILEFNLINVTLNCIE